jgi:hypothetical protein
MIGLLSDIKLAFHFSDNFSRMVLYINDKLWKTLVPRCC